MEHSRGMSRLSAGRFNYISPGHFVRRRGQEVATRLGQSVGRRSSTADVDLDVLLTISLVRAGANARVHK